MKPRIASQGRERRPLLRPPRAYDITGSPLLPIGYVDSRIEQVSCQEAVKDAGGSKPIEVKRVDPAVRKKLDSSLDFLTDN